MDDETLNDLKVILNTTDNLLLDKGIKEYQKINIVEDAFEDIEIGLKILNKTASLAIDICNKMIGFYTNYKNDLNNISNNKNYDLLVVIKMCEIAISHLQDYKGYFETLLYYFDSLSEYISITKELHFDESKLTMYEKFDKNEFLKNSKLVFDLKKDLENDLDNWGKEFGFNE